MPWAAEELLRAPGNQSWWVGGGVGGRGGGGGKALKFQGCRGAAERGGREQHTHTHQYPNTGDFLAPGGELVLSFLEGCPRGCHIPSKACDGSSSAPSQAPTPSKPYAALHDMVPACPLSLTS